MSITLVQSKQAEFTAVTSGAITFTSPVTAGNLLVVRFNEWDANARTPSCADTTGSTPDSFSSTALRSGAGSQREQIFYALSAKGGTTQVTITLSPGSGSWDMSIEEWSGPGTWSVGVSGNNTQSSSVTSHNDASASVTTNANPSLLIGSDTLNAGGGTLTAGTGFTSITATNNGVFWQYQITTGSITTQGPFTSSIARNDAADLIEFLSAAAAGPSYVPPGLKTVFVDQDTGEILAA